MRSEYIQTVNLLGSNIAASRSENVCDVILTLASARKSAYVCFATAHMLVETIRRADVQIAYSQASIICPDGAPVAWFVRLLSRMPAECISGPRILPKIIQRSQESGLKLGFYGGQDRILMKLKTRIIELFPEAQVVFCSSPPFRCLSLQEIQQDIAAMEKSGVEILFVGLGSPRQECWMNEYGVQLNCVCLGVGAAFDFFTGERNLPPLWIQKLGLTCLARLIQEPRRLFRRNLYSPIFLTLALSWSVMTETQRNKWKDKIAYRLFNDISRGCGS